MSKGEETRERIVDRAFRIASREGLEGISIGNLAAELGLSKSGLFAHFGSKEDLQVQILKAAATRFEEAVMLSAFKAARGLPRIRKIFERWMSWLNDPGVPGGCIFIAAATELDDRDGKPRDFLVGMQRQLLDSLAKSAQLSVQEGHFRRDLDCSQFAFDFMSIMLGANYQRRLLRDSRTEARVRDAFERLISNSQPRTR